MFVYLYNDSLVFLPWNFMDFYGYGIGYILWPLINGISQ